MTCGGLRVKQEILQNVEQTRVSLSSAESKGFLSGGENPPVRYECRRRVTFDLPHRAVSYKGLFEPLQRRELITQNQTEKKQEHKRGVYHDERTKLDLGTP